MLTKSKKLFSTDNFSYFIRYFAVFTLIFVSMTIMIFQVMRATMYRSSDENFQLIASDPGMIMGFAMARGLSPDVDVVFEQSNQESTTSSETESFETTSSSSKQNFMPPYQPQTKIRLNTNYHIILFDGEGNRLNAVDDVSGLADVSLNTKDLNQIEEIEVTTAFEDVEYYRTMTIQLDSSTYAAYSDLGVEYATILFNTSQIKSSIASYETTVVVVMISFWLISIFASFYLANLSMRPILISFQKQKDFVENASHELRTPLAVLQNRLESLFRHPEATILESSENIASSLEEVRNMRLLTTNLLNLARREDGLKPDLTEVGPEFFEDVFENYGIIAEENGKELTVTNHVHQLVKTDKVLLKQLMTILFDNAMKYSDEDGKIELTVFIKDRNLHLLVSDNGIGISAEDKKKIFDRFYRVDKARTRQKGGFGLGLSLAKQIVQSLNGDIQVKNNQPKGTVFEVKLPR
ncbi:HAMP domain-containing histidine kinase [Streptococcus suis]|uniref:histidine kinase n=1 Tax=Streptococcus suis TaxID=1307 RepID=A0A4T2GR50_STRSU|nr:HAMP domain-containing histidine kinase [Streptococcus suis]MBM7269126.1 HAMP domain-containing histidine kinase [Streptococcus suis]TII01160.1 HAMP domain-containing histidine kinase [Streptococcus suis]